MGLHTPVAGIGHRGASRRGIFDALGDTLSNIRGFTPLFVDGWGRPRDPLSSARVKYRKEPGFATPLSDTAKNPGLRHSDRYPFQGQEKGSQARADAQDDPQKVPDAGEALLDHAWESLEDLLAQRLQAFPWTRRLRGSMNSCGALRKA